MYLHIMVWFCKLRLRKGWSTLTSGMFVVIKINVGQAGMVDKARGLVEV